MNRRLKVLLAALILPIAMAGSAQAQDLNDNCNPVRDGTGDPVVSSSGAVVSNSFPAPCPEPAPAAETTLTPAGPQSFLVFFDWDRADITPAGDAVIQQAVQAIQGGASAQISVVGHTDTSGPTDYNDGLSQRRAAAVQEQLVRYGIAPAQIVTDARGETNLLVQTPDGVREAANRRTEIVLQ